MQLLKTQLDELSAIEKDLQQQDYSGAVSRAGKFLEFFLKNHYSEAIANLPPAKQKELTNALMVNLATQKNSLKLDSTDKWTIGAWVAFYKQSRFFDEYERVAGQTFSDFLKGINWEILLKIRNKSAHDKGEAVNCDEALLFVSTIRLLFREFANWKPVANPLRSFLVIHKAKIMITVFSMFALMFLWGFWIQPRYFPVVMGCATQEIEIMSHPFYAENGTQKSTKVGAISGKQCLHFSGKTKDKRGVLWFQIANGQFKNYWVPASRIEISLPEKNR